MQTSVVVVGAGPGGLAMSHHLTGAGVDHVLLERGEVAHSWRTERWDSLRLLTPNSMTALPGARYEGDDPDGYMTAAETVGGVQGMPLLPSTHRAGRRHRGRGGLSQRRRVQVRTTAEPGTTNRSSPPRRDTSKRRLPEFASGLPRAIRQLTSLSYQRPARIDDRGRVLEWVRQRALGRDHEDDCGTGPP